VGGVAGVREGVWGGGAGNRESCKNRTGGSEWGRSWVGGERGVGGGGRGTGRGKEMRGV